MRAWVEILKSSIAGRVWDDSANYDGLQATTTNDAGQTVLDEAHEPGIPGQEMRITQWLYVKKSGWEKFVTYHSDLVSAMLTDAERATYPDADAMLAHLDELWALLANEAAGGEGEAASFADGLWVRNLLFGEERYTAETPLDANGDPETDAAGNVVRHPT